MIIVTGAKGFIGSAIVWALNQRGIDDIGLVDLGESVDGNAHLAGLNFETYWSKEAFRTAVLAKTLPQSVTAIIHMGACSSTTEMDLDYLQENNTDYTRILAEYCLEKGLRFINASSAATYGNGERGFSDDHAGISNLTPINGYAWSKQYFDLWALEEGVLDEMVCLKFFNVFGPNEYHKEGMRSVVCKAFEQIGETGELKLFKSYRTEYSHGGQKRDFVYIKDCVDVVTWLLDHPEVGGIYNLGTGTAETWNALGEAVFDAMGRERNITYIEMPEQLRDQYQYFTEAEMHKLTAAGYDRPFTPLHAAVQDYVQGYLQNDYASLS